MSGGAAAPPRIGIVVSGRHLGSREQLFFAVAEALAARGWRVDLLTAGPEPSLRDAVPAGLALHDIGPPALRALPLPRLLRFALSPPTLARWLREARPALLFGTSIPPNLTAVAAARWAGGGIPIVLRQSNTIRIPGHPRYSGLRRRWRDPWIPRAYRAATRVIAVAEEVADNLRAIGAATPDRIVVIHNAVAADRAARLAGEPAPHPWLEPSARAAGGPLLVSVGRLVAKKDQLGLLAAVAKLRERRPVRLVVFGEGPMRGALEKRVRELGLLGAVALPGHVDNPFAAIARADAFVLSSISEGMPSVLIEALACGTPVVSTDCPSGPREILADGRFGELAPVGDPAGLAAAIERALDAPADPGALRERAAGFALDRVVPRYVAVLEEAAGVRQGEEGAATLGSPPIR